MQGPDRLDRMSEMADRLRAMRAAAGLSQPQLARKLGVSQAWVSNRETGRAQVKTADLDRVAAALGLQAEVVMLPRGSMALASAAAEASPEVVAVALDLLTRVDSLAPAIRGMVIQMVEQAISAGLRAAVTHEPTPPIRGARGRTPRAD
jgi:transcriptional regulator with XRE-family HTH domain